MQLEFEVLSEVGIGNYPDVVHFANTQAQVFYLQDGELFGQPTNRIDNGEWENATFQDESNASPDTGMSHLELKVLPGWGIIGGYKTGNFHKMIIYEFAWEMGQYLNNGSIKHSNDPVSSFSLSLENPDLKDPEKPGNVAIGEEGALLSPGSKLVFKFSTGDTEEYELGTFYVDRSNLTLLSETASVDGRNLIGKALKDQTIDENNEYWYDNITNILTQILLSANLTAEQFLIENTSRQNWFNFDPTTTPYKAIEDIRNLMVDWKIEELTDGTIVIGSPNYPWFEKSGIYNFYRNKDIFSRQITRDDAEVFNRVCVHTEGFGIAVYRDIEVYEGWKLQGKKTYYIKVAEGTRLAQIEEYADRLATQLGSVGKIESFTGPFRPHLMKGDEAIINNENGSKALGMITEVTHNFGKSGFYTNFSVDSGGKLGRGRLSDFIKRISVGDSGGVTNIGYNDVSDDGYRNLGPEAKIISEDEHYDGYNRRYRGVDKAFDGDMDTTWHEWSQWIQLEFGHRCVIDKIVLYDDSAHLGYKIQFWNTSFWVDLITEPAAEQNSSGSGKTYTYEFPAIETSKIKIIFNTKNHQRIKEIEIFGKD